MSKRSKQTIHSLSTPRPKCITTVSKNNINLSSNSNIPDRVPSNTTMLAALSSYHSPCMWRLIQTWSPSCVGPNHTRFSLPDRGTAAMLAQEPLPMQLLPAPLMYEASLLSSLSPTHRISLLVVFLTDEQSTQGVISCTNIFFPSNRKEYLPRGQASIPRRRS